MACGSSSSAWWPAPPLTKTHPEWLLERGDGPQGTYLLNFGLPKVQQYFFEIVKRLHGAARLPLLPLGFQRGSAAVLAPQRPAGPPGDTEMKYIEGLYAFWDQLAQAWPDSLREECASGGRRIDLETIQRMHLHQESDYWFDNEVDLAASGP